MMHSTRGVRALALASVALVLPLTAAAQDITILPGAPVGAQAITGLGEKITLLPGASVRIATDFADALSLLNDQQTLLVGTGASVETLGVNDFNVFSQGLDATILNNGTISATGDFSVGIASIGDRATIANGGTISMTGALQGWGIYAAGTGTSITNTGQIVSTTLGGSGIIADGVQQTITNGGLVSASGDGGTGIILAQDGATLQNAGAIETTGLASTALVVNGNGATITNFGSLMSPLDSLAVIVSGDDALLALGPGTRIQGGISFTGLNDTLSILPGLNTALDIFPVPDNLTTNGAPFATDGTLLAVVDTTAWDAAPAMLDGLSRNAANVLDARSHKARGLWSVAFGQANVQESAATRLNADLAASGFLAGVDGVIAPDVSLGVFAGLAATGLETQTASHKLDGNAVLGGAYMTAKANPGYATLSFTGGKASIDSTRFIINNTVASGMEQAKARGHATFVAPSLTIGTDMDYGLYVLQPSLRLRYAHIAFSSLAETGSVAALNLAAHDADVLGARSQMLLQLKPTELASGQTITPQFAVGLDVVHTRQDGLAAELLGLQGQLHGRTRSTQAEAFASAAIDVALSSSTQMNAQLEINATAAGFGLAGIISAAHQF